MISLTFAMLAILGSWVVLGALLVGLGCLALAWVEPGPWHGERAFSRFWLGYLVALAVLQVWQLFAPVREPALVFLAAWSAVGFWVRRAGLLSFLRRSAREDRRLWVASAVLALWLANRALGPPVGDSGLYHLSVVRWFTSFPIVPGLANLHYRLGFNNPSLLWSALLEAGPWYGRSSHLANGVLVLAIGLRGLWGLSRSLRGSGRPVDLFGALLLPVVVAHAVTLFELRVSSPDPDTAAALAALAAAIHLVALLTEPDATSTERQVNAFSTASLAVLASCIKVSMVPFSAGLVLLSAVEAVRPGLRPMRAPVLAWIATLAGLGLPWLVRGVILSGYPLFPASILPYPSDWLVPRADMELLASAIREHFMPPVAQQMRAAGEGWVRPWLVWQATRVPELALLPLALCVSGLALLRGARRGVARRAALLLLPCGVAALVWLVSAPHPRFAYGFLWAAAAASWTAASSGDLARPGSPRRALLVLLLVVGPSLPLVHRVAAFLWSGDPERAIASVVLAPGPDHGLVPTPVAELRLDHARSGLAVWLPEDGNQVWDAPLPATPELRPGLTLRRPGELRGGFRQ